MSAETNIICNSGKEIRLMDGILQKENQTLKGKRDFNIEVGSKV